MTVLLDEGVGDTIPSDECGAKNQTVSGCRKISTPHSQMPFINQEM